MHVLKDHAPSVLKTLQLMERQYPFSKMCKRLMNKYIEHDNFHVAILTSVACTLYLQIYTINIVLLLCKFSDKFGLYINRSDHCQVKITISAHYHNIYNSQLYMHSPAVIPFYCLYNHTMHTVSHFYYQHACIIFCAVASALAAAV